MHPILRFLLVACGFVSLLAACETAPVSGRSQVMLVSENEEREMGLQAYREVLNKEPLSRDAQVNAMVDKVGRRIANAAEHPPQELWRAPRFRWEFKTVDKNEPNAFCLPGGKVVVYTGLLPITKTETGMAVVVAHEVAHALARHGAERMSDQMVASVGTAAAAVALSATVSGRSRTYLPAMMAGYDPREAVALWERMRAASSGKRQAEWLSTHPADTTRIADIRRWLPEAMQYYKPR